MLDRAFEFDCNLCDKPLGGGRRSFKVTEGQSISDIIREADIPKVLIPNLVVIVSFGGKSSEIGISYWGRVKPKRGAMVEIYPRVEGAILAPILGALVASAAPVIAGALFPLATGFGLALATAAVSVVGTLLVNSLIPPAQVARSHAEDPRYALSLSSNQSRPFEPFPTVLGRHAMYPPKTAKGYTETVGEDIYLRERMTFGYGPVALEELKIGTTDLADFEGVEVEFLNVDRDLTEAAIPELADGTINVIGWRTGTQSLSLYSENISQDGYSVELTGGNVEGETTSGAIDAAIDFLAGWIVGDSDGGQNAEQATEPSDDLLEPVVRTTQVDTLEAHIDVSFNSLVKIKDDGSRASRRVDILIQYRRVGNSTWIEHGILECEAATSTHVRFVSEIKFPSAGQFDIRLTRLTKESDQTRVQDTAVLSAIRSIQSGGLPSHDNVAEIAIRIKASGELNGQIQQLRAIVQQLGRVWDGAKWLENQPLRHPAWVYANALTGSQLKRKIADHRLVLEDFKAWADHEPHWTCDYVVQGRQTARDVLDIIAATGRAKRGMKDFAYSVIREIGEGAPIQIFTPRNSWGFSATKFLEEKLHALRIRVLSERNDWKPDEIMVYADGYSSANAINIETMELPGVVLSRDGDNLGNAWRLGRYFLAVAEHRQEEYRWSCSLEHLRCQVGDRVILQRDEAVMGLGSARIKSVDRDESGNVTALLLDSAFDVEGVGNCILTACLAEGGMESYACSSVDGVSWLVEGVQEGLQSVEPGDLVLVQQAGIANDEVVITKIEHEGDLVASIAAQPSAPVVAGADTGSIPPYDPNIAPVYVDGPPFPTPLLLRSGYDVAVINRAGGLSPRIALSLGPIGGSFSNGLFVKMRWRRSGVTVWDESGLLPFRSEILTGSLEVGVYAVEVATVDGQGRSKGWVAAGSVEATVEGSILPTPTGWQSVAGVDSITLFTHASYTAPDFRNFNIYAATASDDTLHLVGETSARNFDYKPEVNYTRYRVTAVDFDGRESLPTAFIEAVPTGVTAGDLAVEVTEMIDTARADADAAAQAAVGALQEAAGVRAAHEALVDGFSYSLPEYKAWMEANLTGMLPSDFSNDADFFQGASTSKEPSANWSQGSFVDDAAMSARVAVLGPANQTIAPKGVVRVDHAKVYEIAARVRVSDEGTMGVLNSSLGIYSWNDAGVSVNSNNQELHDGLTAVSGVIEIKTIIAGSESGADAGDVHLVLDSSVAFFRPHFRANRFESDAVVHIASLKVTDITGAMRADYVGQSLSVSVAANSGAITDIMGLGVDSESSFGVLLSQLQVDSGGTSAVIDQFASAVANLDGFASAYAGLTVETNGGNIAGFRATSYSDPDGTGSGVLELLGDVIAEGSLSTNKLTVGLGRNLLSNTDFSDGLNGWVFASNGDQNVQSAFKLRPPGIWSGPTYSVLQIYQGGTGQSGVADIRHRPFMSDGVQSFGVPVTPGDWIEVSAQFSIHRCVAQLRIQYYDASGASLIYSPILASGDSVNSSQNNPDVWPVYWGKHQVPANAAFATVHIRKGPTNSGANSYLFVHKPQLAVSHAGASEPAPYSPGGTTLISGNKIMTGAVTAEKIQAGAIEGAHIAANTIEGSHIKTDTLEITDDAIVSGASSKGVWADINSGHIEIPADSSGYFNDPLVREFGAVGTLMSGGQVASSTVLLFQFNCVPSFTTPGTSGSVLFYPMARIKATGVWKRSNDPILVSVTGDDWDFLSAQIPLGLNFDGETIDAVRMEVINYDNPPLELSQRFLTVTQVAE